MHCLSKGAYQMRDKGSREEKTLTKGLRAA
jgi:hypothetical protein